MALSLFIFLHFFNFNKRKTNTLKFANFELAKTLNKGSKNYFKLIIRIIILVLLIFAISGSIYEHPSEAQNFNFILALDTNFNQEEFDSIKESLTDFITILPQGTNTAILTSSKKTEITSDKTKVISSINSININNENIDIENSIKESISLLLNEEERIVKASRRTTFSPIDILLKKKKKIVVFITKSQEKISVEEIIDKAVNDNIIIYPVLVNFEKNIINEDFKLIADNTGGEFFSVDRRILLDQTFRKISEITIGKTAIELKNPILILILILLILAWSVEYIRFGVIP